ncbi:MAG: hypothetical protein MPN21_10265 [Thermoanaerobaculia bacterium]|nr:hypothetical protein [Thermoanaerobaculia bacterium]
MANPERPEPQDSVADEIERAAQEAVKTQRDELSRLQTSGEKHRKAKQSRRRNKILAAVVLTTAAVALTILNLMGRGFFSVSVPQQSPEEVAGALRDALYVEAAQLLIDLEEGGSLPASVADMALDPEAGWSYERLGEQDFRLSVAEGALSYSYSSSEDLETWYSGSSP